MGAKLGVPGEPIATVAVIDIAAATRRPLGDDRVADLRPGQPAHDYRLHLDFGDGVEVTFDRYGTAVDVAAYIAREGRGQVKTCDPQAVSDQLGEMIHTALRKASDHPKAWEAYKAIDELPHEEWGRVLAWIRGALNLPPESE